MKRAAGFTLIEMISVLVILAILAAIGSSFLITTVDAYRATEVRAKLLARGRTSVEQMTRQLRLAVPNSLRVSSSGACIEFFPLVGGANYLNDLPDNENMAPPTSSIAVSPLLTDLGSPAYVIIGALSATDIYTSGSPSARVGLASTSGTPINTLNLSSSHRFIRNSISKRVFVADNPKRFCVSGGSLLLYHSYGVDTGPLTDASPGGTIVLMSLEVAASGTAFALAPGSENRNAAALISLVYSGNGEQVELNQEVLVRNVP